VQLTSSTKETTVQVAVVQAAAVPFDAEACVDKAVRLIGEAAATGAKVIVFPEGLSADIRRGSATALLLARAMPPGVKSFGFISTRQSKFPVRKRSGSVRLPRYREVMW